MKKHQPLFSNTCGRCHSGKIFRNFFWANMQCPSCGHKFEKEEGYYIGAMIISYFVTAFLALPTLLIGLFRYQWEFNALMGLVCIQILITGPIIYRYSKLVWIHIEERFTEHLNQPKKS